MPTGPQRQGPAPKEPRTQRRLVDRFPEYEHPKGFSSLVTARDISDVLGVSGPVVSNWINRHPQFPTPKLIAGQGRGAGMWDLGDIANWHSEHIEKSKASQAQIKRHQERKQGEIS